MARAIQDSSIFPDEEGTERTACATAETMRTYSSIFPDEEGTESLMAVSRMAGRVGNSSIFPDEEGTESVGERHSGAGGEATQQHLPR